MKNIHEIVRKLLGEIDPVGESHTDEIRFKNLEATIALTDKLLGDIDRVATNKTRAEYSMEKAGERASEFFDELGIEE